MYTDVIEEHDKTKLSGNEEKLTNNDQSTKKKMVVTFLSLTLCVTCFSVVLALVITKKINVPALMNIKQRVGLENMMILNSLLKKKSGFPPSSYSIYANSTENLEEDPVPIIVDVPGRDWLVIPTALSECLGYKAISSEKGVSR